MNSLPEGLITLTGDTNLISVDPEVIARLWRIYNTNPSIHPGIVGHRLENFFWRIWGSSILRSSLDGSTLARLFERISDTSYQVEGVVHQQVQLHPQPKRPLPPILKKPNSAQGDLPKTARLLLTSPEGQSFTRSPSNPPTPIPPSALTMEPEAQSQSQIKKVSKPSSANSVYNYMASSKKSSTRRRPMIVRHKSRASPTGLTHGSNSNPNTRSQSPLSEGWVDLLDGEEEEDEEDEEDQTHKIQTPTPPPTQTQTAEDNENGKEKENPKPKLPASFVARLRSHMISHPPSLVSGDLTLDPFSNPKGDDIELWYGWYRQPTKTRLSRRNFRSRFEREVREMQALTQVEEAACVEDGMHGVEGEVEAKVKANVGIGAGVEVGGNVGSKKPVESGTTAVSASTGAGVSIDTPESTPNPTPASDCDSLEPIQSTGVFRMDVSFEELEELCPMVW